MAATTATAAAARRDDGSMYKEDHPPANTIIHCHCAAGANPLPRLPACPTCNRRETAHQAMVSTKERGQSVPLVLPHVAQTETGATNQGRRPRTRQPQNAFCLQQTRSGAGTAYMNVSCTLSPLTPTRPPSHNSNSSGNHRRDERRSCSMRVTMRERYGVRRWVVLCVNMAPGVGARAV